MYCVSPAAKPKQKDAIHRAAIHPSVDGRRWLLCQADQSQKPNQVNQKVFFFLLHETGSGSLPIPWIIEESVPGISSAVQVRTLYLAAGGAPLRAQIRSKQ